MRSENQGFPHKRDAKEILSRKGLGGAGKWRTARGMFLRGVSQG